MVRFIEVLDGEFETFVIVAKDFDFASSKFHEVTGFDFPKPEKFDYNDISRVNVFIGGKLTEVIVAGAGQNPTAADIEKLGGYIYSKIESTNSNVCLLNNLEMAGAETVATLLASGMMLKSWKFDKYFSVKKPEKIKSITAKTNYGQINTNAMKVFDDIRSAVFDVREMVSEPANIMTPERLKDMALGLEDLGIKVKVLDRKDMEKLGMQALLGVAKGSDNPAYTVIMEYSNGNTDEVLGLVGKGVTFDSGGLCLKPSKGMGDMKGDMTGAAVVIGSIKALALQQVPVNVVGAIGIVENTINGKAQKPGDIVKAMSGATIEVDNTDAEGRLVLADVLHYIQEKYKPKIVIDFATLTGAIQVALGHEFAGYMSNSKELSDMLEESSARVGEKIWKLPLHDSYKSDIKSDVADIKNVGCGRGAGSITAAMFLKHFIKENVKWAHIDIAATEWDTKDRALSAKGATGFGVRLVFDFAKSLEK